MATKRDSARLAGKNAAKRGEAMAGNRITREEADQILKSGYPDVKQLERFPLGDVLKTIPEINPPYGVQNDTNPGHIRKVLKGMNVLLGDRPYEVVGSWQDAQEKQRKFQGTHAQIFHGAGQEGPYCQLRDSDKGPFFRLCVLYHDIGKSVIHERHPLVGWHLIKDVYRQRVENELYPLLLGVGENDWDHSNLSSYQKRMIALFDAVIKFHDLFGVLSTGEGSLPVMVDLVRLTRTEPMEAKELFSILMLFNLADLYGSVPTVHPYKVDLFCTDLATLCEAIEEADGKRERFFDILREMAQGMDATIERLTRFLDEEAPGEYRGEPIRSNIVDAFRGATIGGMNSFCTNFALFCKLDYALAFKRALMTSARSQEEKAGVPPDVTRTMTKLLWLLVQLEKQYGDLCRRRDGSWRRIGVELAGLTRKAPGQKDSTIGERICELLLKDRGQDWAAGECTVWFMEE